MNWSNEQRKQLIEKYPYLIPRNMWTGEIVENYDYSYVRGESEIPTGWVRLFFLYVKNIRPYLEPNGLLNRFMFSDIKEKYGTLRLYDFGAPKMVHVMATIYESFSQYICSVCGDFATQESRGWICPYCNKCLDKVPFICDPIIYNKHAKTLYWDNEHFCEVADYYSFKSLRKEYEKIIKLTDEEFYNYLMT